MSPGKRISSWTKLSRKENSIYSRRGSYFCL